MNYILKRFKNNLHTNGYLFQSSALKSTLMWHSFLNLHKKAILKLRIVKAQIIFYNYFLY